ncbi:hypothetical protein [Streptomyces sp. ODS05-4]|uniref:hypothetical protein n=1 Tax=Streptomyces sp. ODS05-4 TaxID=2944939 RepID=UPI00210D3294|nr:hypothetical protein [Streptomyces sp. ODS05-4]
MNGVDVVLRALHQGERHMVHRLLAAAERHHGEHEVHHVATDIAGWSRAHAQQLADAACRRGLDLGAPDPSTPGGAPAAAAWGEDDDSAGQRFEPGLQPLHDLRGLHLDAAGNSLYWEMLAQTAQATGDDRLLGVARACHPQTLRQMRWTDTMIKNLSPQILMSR